MVAATNETVKIVKKFLQLVKSAGIEIEKTILFGSYAIGKGRKWSDIDLAVVSSNFSGISFYDSKRLTPFLLKVDSRIELYPFKSEDFTKDNAFVCEIIKNGLEIKI